MPEHRLDVVVLHDNTRRIPEAVPWDAVAETCDRHLRILRWKWVGVGKHLPTTFTTADDADELLGLTEIRRGLERGEWHAILENLACRVAIAVRFESDCQLEVAAAVGRERV